MKTKTQAIFLNPFIFCSYYTGKFVVYPFVYEKTIGSYPFVNGLNRFAHLCMFLESISADGVNFVFVRVGGAGSLRTWLGCGYQEQENQVREGTSVKKTR
jgi:hypothetical protein